MAKDDWQRNVTKAAQLYKDGMAAAAQRRLEWEHLAKQIVVPIFREIVDAFKAAGLYAAQESGPEWRGRRMERLSVAGGLTGVTWVEGGGRQRQIEHSATFGYSETVNGMAVRWMYPHVLADSKPLTGNDVTTYDESDVFEPSKLTVERVREHLKDFLELAFESSYAGWDRQRIREVEVPAELKLSIGFKPPTQ